MRFPSMISNIKMFSAYFAIAIVAIITLATVPAAGQKTDNASATLEQCRNGSAGNQVGCVVVGGAVGWVTGNAGAANSHWAEDQFLAYRMLFDDLTTGTHTVILGYDVFHQGVHAIDYLGSYNATEATANPCVDVNPACVNPPDTFTVPTETTLGLATPGGQTAGVFTMWGGDITDVSYVESYAGGDERRISVTFTANVSNPVLAWGGHVGWQGDWGVGNSAGGISGAPYHMRLIDLDGSGGNQDRSLSADSVLIGAKLTIIKDAVPVSGTISTQPFNFTADPEFGVTAFTLIDNGVSGDNDHESAAINTFGSPNAILITEAFTPGWSLDAVICTGNSTAPVVNLAARTANITVQEAEDVICTFVNGQIRPSAAPASITGRVATQWGRGISGAVVTIFNTSTGESQSYLTNSFGYYRFNDLAVADFYVMTVSHKRYLFLEASRSFTLEEDLFDMDFTAAEDF